jgi:hypothetical protein
MAVYDNGPVRFVGVSHVTDALGANHPEVGTMIREGDEEYVWVYNNGGEQIGPSYGAVLDWTSNVTGYSVTISSTTSVDFLVGVCKHATITTAAYGWLMTRGWTKVEMEADNSCVTGQLLALAANGEFALKSNSTGYPTPAVGQSLESIASGASGDAFISVR